MRPFYLAILLVGCHAATVGVAPRETGGEADDAAAEAEAAIDASLILPDGRVCMGHDHDFDTKPDECDECPAIPDQIALGTGSWNAVGPACASIAPFAEAKHRVRFFSFEDQPDVEQHSDMPFTVRAVPMASVFETPPGGDDAKLRFVLFNEPVDPSLLVATMYVNLLDNLKSDEHVGLLMRGGAINPDGLDFYFCWAGPTLFGLARAPSMGCNGAECTLDTMKQEDGTDATKTIPDPAKVPPVQEPDAPTRYRALRASMSSDATSDFVECRVFQAGGPGLQNGSDDYVVRARVPAATRPPGKKLGLAIQRSQGWFLSLDVHGR